MRTVLLFLIGVALANSQTLNEVAIDRMNVAPAMRCAPIALEIPTLPDAPKNAPATNHSVGIRVRYESARPSDREIRRCSIELVTSPVAQAFLAKWATWIKQYRPKTTARWEIWADGSLVRFQ